jgi:putative ABC transport system permease protein
VDGVIQDIKFSLRMLRKAPGATAVALLSLTLGLSVNTTVFSWVRSVLLNPLPGVADADRVVTIETVTPSGEMIDASFPDYQDFRDRSTLLAGVIAFKERPLGLGADARTDRVWSLMVSGNYFDVLGLKPALGRFFDGIEQSDAFDAAPVAVLGHAMWKARFGGDPSIVGKRIVLNRRPFSVIGVAPEGFAGTITGLRFDLYVPLTMQASLTGGAQWLAMRSARPLYLFARLKPGVTLPQAATEVQAIAAAIAREHAGTNRGMSAAMLPQSSARRGIQSDMGQLLRILVALGAFVLLIVCANVANLQLARATVREREIAVRLTLGAGRWRLLRQLLTEHIVLGLIAGGIAVLVSAWLVDALRLFTPFIEYPLELTLAVGVREIAYAGAASVAAALLVGIWPALRLSEGRLADALKAGARQSGGERRGAAFRAGLVVGEVALAMFALAAAGLLVRSFQNVRRADPGFDASGVLLAGVNLSTGGYDRPAGLAYLQRVLERTNALPGVASVSLAEDVPLGFNGGSWEDLGVDGYVPSASENMKIYRNLVSPNYFTLMRIPMLAGRDFTARDDRSMPMVAIVNEEFARRYFGGASPIGRQFRGWGVPHTIVGIVKTTKVHNLAEGAQPYFYVPLWQHFTANTGVALHVRTPGDPSLMIAPLRRELQALDPEMPPPLFVTLTEYMGASYFVQRTAAMLMTVLAALALALASIGLYSLIAFGVSARRRELGVRVALGAASGDIVRMVVGEGVRIAALGVGAGFLLSAIGTRALGSLLFGISPLDVPTLLGAAALLGAIGVTAAYIPARAAARVDPMQALRAE